MEIRDRIRELRRVKASELVPHPKNWRTHPVAQKKAIEGILGEIGYADALIARELSDGKLQLIDGHLRAETTPDLMVPVLVLDVDEAEAEKILLTLDPLAGLAGYAEEELDDLLSRVETESNGIRDLLNEVAKDAALARRFIPELEPGPEVEIAESYQVVVECKDEQDQEFVFEKMVKEGYRCRVLML